MPTTPDTFGPSRLIWPMTATVLKNLVGGEIQECTKLMAESREQAIDRMMAQAK